MKLAAAKQRLTECIAMSAAAQGLHAMVDGLIQNWLLDTGGFDLAETGAQVIDVYLAGIGFKLNPPGAKRA